MRRVIVLQLLLWVSILGAQGCGDDPPANVPCQVSTDCQLDEVCTDGLCKTSHDRLRRDAGASD